MINGSKKLFYIALQNPACPGVIFGNFTRKRLKVGYGFMCAFCFPT
jgi:hypothetical protein